MKQDICCWSW